MVDLEEEVLAALAAGADAYCLESLRTRSASRTPFGIAADGGAYFDPQIAHVVLVPLFRRQAESAARSSPLTPRETEVFA